MPELPEVEVARRALEPHVTGRRVVEVEVRDPRLTQPEAPAAVEARLRGSLVERLERRGKYLIWHVDSGLLVTHLRMTGMFSPLGSGLDEPARVRAVMHLGGGERVIFTDTRRFGTWQFVEFEDAAQFFAMRLGPEPLGEAFSPSWLADALASRRAPIKAALLDQRVVAGLGNVYVDEALFAAGVDPRSPAQLVSGEALERLTASIRDVLRSGIELGGSTIRDYRSPDGAMGRAQERHAVYGRAGLPCFACGETLSTVRIAGRSSVYCARCQPGYPSPA